MVTACTVTPLFDALSAFHAAHPGVELSLLEDGSDRLIERVRSGEADLALTGAAAMPEGLEGFPVISERLVAAVPAGHPLTRRKRVTLADIATHPVVCLPEGTGIRTGFDRGCAARGMRPDIALQASAPGSVADLAARGLGVAILTASMVDDQALRGLEIADLAAPALLALVWRDTDAPRCASSCATAARRSPSHQPRDGPSRKHPLTGLRPLSHGCGRPQRFRPGARSGRATTLSSSGTTTRSLSRARSSSTWDSACSTPAIADCRVGRRPGAQGDTAASRQRRSPGAPLGATARC
jgi:hypothetical protein